MLHLLFYHTVTEISICNLWRSYSLSVELQSEREISAILVSFFFTKNPFIFSPCPFAHFFFLFTI